MRFILLKRIGDAFVTEDVPDMALADVLGKRTAYA